jgi:hypothetical protein
VSAEAQKEFSGGGGLLALWAGLLAGPAAFLSNLQVNYMLVPWVCATGHRFALHIVALCALLVTAAGGFAAWRAWLRTGKRWSDAGGGAVPRSRFMAIMGMLISAMFFLVILAMGIPNFVMNPCQP